MRKILSGRKLALVILAVLAIPMFLVTHQTNYQLIAAGSRFVTKAGTQLTVNGQPLRLIGYNYTWLGSGCANPSDEQLDTDFSNIQQEAKGNVIRTAFYQSGSNNLSFADFDRYVAAAKRHGLYLVPMLVNEWQSCEPNTQNAKWYDFYNGGYTQANWPTENNYSLSFRDYAIKIAQHYINEPTIAFWQLVNEPDDGFGLPQGVGCGSQTAQVMRTFADDMTHAIKSVDSNHMVDVGVLGGCSGDNTTDFKTVVSGNVDLCDVWHDYDDVTTALPSALDQRLKVCQSLDKPSFVGESGICSDVNATGSCTGTITQSSLNQRAQFFDAKLHAGFSDGLSGYIIWNYGQEGAGNDNVFIGDPTQSILANITSPGQSTGGTATATPTPMPTTTPTPTTITVWGGRF